MKQSSLNGLLLWYKNGVESSGSFNPVFLRIFAHRQLFLMHKI